MSDANIAVDLYPVPDQPLEVRCVEKAGTNKLMIDRVTFHALSDADYDAIIDAIEDFRFRKKKRERNRLRAIVAANPGAPE